MQVTLLSAMSLDHVDFVLSLQYEYPDRPTTLRYVVWYDVNYMHRPHLLNLFHTFTPDLLVGINYFPYVLNTQSDIYSRY